MSILLLQKPFCASKPKDHSTCLERYMFSWIAGYIKGLLSEGQSIPKRLPKTGHLSNDIGHLARSFSKLMIRGEIHAALQLLEKGGKGGTLHPDDKVDTNNPDSLSIHEVLKPKHPHAQQATAEALLEGPVLSPSHSVIFESINAASTHTASTTYRGCSRSIWSRCSLLEKVVHLL